MFVSGGNITIDFFSNDDVRAILDLLSTKDKRKVDELLNRHIASVETVKDIANLPKITDEEALVIDDRSAIEKKEEEESEDLYSVKNFSL